MLIPPNHRFPRPCPLEAPNADEAVALVAVVEGGALDRGEVKFSAER